MSSVSLSKRRKHELKDICLSLGLSDDGLREDLVDRIKTYISQKGTSDPALRDLVGDDSEDVSVSSSRRSSITTTTTTTPDSPSRRSGRRSNETNRLASLSSANEEDSSHQPRLTRLSPKKKSSFSHHHHHHSTTTSNSTRGARDGSDSESAEDPLSEHQVRNFMDTMRDEIGEAKDLAHSLEHTLHEKYQSGKETLRRASKDLTSTVSHALDDAVDAVGTSGIRSQLEKGKAVLRRRPHGGDDDDEEEEGHSHHRHRHHHSQHGTEGWCGTICRELKHRFANCAGGPCNVTTCVSKFWHRIHDLGSTSTGFVWLTMLLELGVFMSGAFSQHQHGGSEGWFHCLGFFTNWANFLKPFFSYYSVLFLVPTLLSQLFNVDRARKVRRHQHEDSSSPATMDALTGLLSRKTTSGLSYFVFKFALTYLLNQSSHAHHGSAGLVEMAKEVAKDAAETVVHHTGGLGGLLQGFGGHHAQACDVLFQVFRYVPASLGLATSGAGTVLALAESIVSAAASRRR